MSSGRAAEADEGIRRVTTFWRGCVISDEGSDLPSPHSAAPPHHQRRGSHQSWRGFLLGELTERSTGAGSGDQPLAWLSGLPAQGWGRGGVVNIAPGKEAVSMQPNSKAFPYHARGALLVTTRPHRRQGCGIWGGVASLLVILFLVPVVPPWAGAPLPGDVPVQRRAPRLQMAVHQGRLSVDLWEADLREVLARIHQQTGISISVRPGPEHTVSVQFTDVALDQGLRRMLQLASRSYAMRYAPGPTGEVALQEVQVFAEAPVGDQSPAGAAHAGENPGTEVGQRFVDAVLQRQAAALAVGREDESDDASRFRDVLERHSASAPGWTEAPESDAARSFRDALEDATRATAR